MYRFIFIIVGVLLALELSAQVHHCGVDAFYSSKEVNGIIQTIENIRDKPISRSRDTLLVPIVFHIIHNNEPEGVGNNVSDLEVLNILNRLNDDFLGRNATFSQTPEQWTDRIEAPLVQFVLPSISPKGDPTNGIERYYYPVPNGGFKIDTLEKVIKPMTAWDAESYYNVWITRIPNREGIIGYTFLPTSGVVGKTGTDGTVIDNQHLQTHVLTHETGHYLGLLHPFFQNSCEVDDGLEDTPNMAQSTLDAGFDDCSEFTEVGPISCEEPHLYTNFMDYSPDACYSSFTRQQVSIMRSVLKNVFPVGDYESRNSLLNAAPIVCPKPTNSLRPLQVVGIEKWPKRTCFSSDLTPTIRIRNTSSIMVSGFRIRILHVGDTSSYSFERTLLPNQETELDFAALTKVLGQTQYRFFVDVPEQELDAYRESDVTFRWLTVFKTSDKKIFDFEEVTSIPSIYQETANTGFNWELVNKNTPFSTGIQAVQVSGFEPAIGKVYDLFGPSFYFPPFDGSKLEFALAFNLTKQTDTLEIFMHDLCQADTSVLILKRPLDASFVEEKVQNIFNWYTFQIPLPNQYRGKEVMFQFRLIKRNNQDVTMDNIALLDCGIQPNYEVIGNPCIDSCAMKIEMDLQSHNPLSLIRFNDIRVGRQASIEGLCQGENLLQIMDSTGCVYEENIRIYRDTFFEFQSSVLPPSFEGASNGKIEIIQTNLPEPLQFRWNTGDTTSLLKGLNSGTFRFTVEDGRRCIFHDSVVLKVANQCDSLTVTHHIDYGSCENTQDNKVSLKVSGGKAPFSYSWSGGFDERELIGVKPGTYEVLVSDANNCQKTATFNVQSIGNVEMNVQYEEPSCLEPSIVRVKPLMGLPPYHLRWSNGKSGFEQEGLENGQYMITLTDARNCEDVKTIDVAFGDAFLNIFSSKFNTTCHNSQDGRIELEVSGGVKPYTYILNDDTVAIDAFKQLPQGKYRLRVLDGKDCQSQLNFEINAPDSIKITTEETRQNENYIVSATVEGGTPPYKYFWSNGQTEPVIRVQDTETLELVVEDANSCRKNYGLQVIPLSVENLNTRFFIYPVPTPDLIIIEKPDSKRTKALIYNSLGQLVDVFEFHSPKTVRDLSHHKTGVYILVLEQEDYREVKRVQLFEK